MLATSNFTKVHSSCPPTKLRIGDTCCTHTIKPPLARLSCNRPVMQSFHPLCFSFYNKPLRKVHIELLYFYSNPRPPKFPTVLSPREQIRSSQLRFRSHATTSGCLSCVLSRAFKMLDTSRNNPVQLKKSYLEKNQKRPSRKKQTRRLLQTKETDPSQLSSHLLSSRTDAGLSSFSWEPCDAMLLCARCIARG
jgi:hypothetical protein